MGFRKRSDRMCEYKNCGEIMYEENIAPRSEYPKKYICCKCGSSVIVYPNGRQEYCDPDGKLFYPNNNDMN